MIQQFGQYNQKVEPEGNRFVAALITELEDQRLALVYIDDRVVLNVVPASEYRYIVLNPTYDIEKARTRFRDAATRLGFDPAVQTYIGEVDGNAHDDAASSRAAAGEPGDAEELASPGQGAGVPAGGHSDPLPADGRGSVGEGQHPRSIDDLIADEPVREDIFS